jgi:hypothetical protein
MPVQINCPSCNGAVRVPEDLLGQRVQCPRCQATFVAEADDDPPVAPGPPATAGGGPDVAPRRPRRPRPADDDFEDDYDYRPRRRYGRPHRGGAVLALGILSIVICTPLGVFAWVMGNSDLDAMRRGEMDREGEGLTQAGKICGIVGTVLMALQCLGVLTYFSILAAVVGGVR